MEKNFDKDLTFKIKIGWMIIGVNMFLIYFFILRFSIETVETIIRPVKNAKKFYKESRKKQIRLMKVNERRKKRAATFNSRSV